MVNNSIEIFYIHIIIVFSQKYRIKFSMNIRDRLIQFLAHENISQGKFEEKVGLSTGFVSKVGDSIRKKSLDKILAVYPNLNTVWLISGVGEMLIPENDHPKRSGKNIIPLYDAEANTVGGMEIFSPPPV